MEQSSLVVPTFTLPVIIGLAVAGVCVAVVLVVILVLLVCLCWCCVKRRKGQFSLWEEDETRRNEGYHSPDIELAPVRFTPSTSPTQRCEAGTHTHADTAHMHTHTQACNLQLMPYHSSQAQ